MMDRAIDVTTRPYRPDELDAVVDLWYGTWHATFPDLRHHEPKAAWRRRFADEIAATEQVYVAEVAGCLAGFLAVRLEDGGSGYLHQIFVAQGCQRRGVGSALIATAKRLAPAGLRLHTLQRNAPAAAFYEGHGFTVVARGIGRVGLPNAQYAWTPSSDLGGAR